MSTSIAILGGVGFVLLRMTVVTDGLKALGGSALRLPQVLSLVVGDSFGAATSSIVAAMQTFGRIVHHAGHSGTLLHGGGEHDDLGLRRQPGSTRRNEYVLS
ncbi:hypothetical protein M2281_002246 [Mesorhizobium soli]|uniref:hypothetical protein n=1 Tax=Pseudaminobacter soli (ex Li et al. 2025) TaxID=1295366 RepID=UPI0024744B76|nr:hypothetical protein [Mesorhizobium soli]MDH6231648.1 hypothetical protein [Mesorhizobium soli]